MANATETYTSEIRKALAEGNATEHTHRPALKSFIESLRAGITATNEPARIACGSPDFIVTKQSLPLGYIEAKDVGTDLVALEESDQLQRYRAGLRNLILTDYLTFRLYRDGEFVQVAHIATWNEKSGLKAVGPDAMAKLHQLLELFLDFDAPTIGEARELAQRMAKAARLLHDLILEVFAKEGTTGNLHAQLDAFRKVLIADLKVEDFADMYAQTIAYGLFAARCNTTSGATFTRQHAGHDLPKTNPFLRKLFNTIAGADLDDRIAWAVDDLANVLAKADMESILQDFGVATQQRDPVVHFYETFLAAYNPALREMRGVYYTPEPVVDYIVRSTEALLIRDFGLPDGLADHSKTKVKLGTKAPKKKGQEIELHKVQILDPACGTGTFLRSVLALIETRFKGSEGLWQSYVSDHLLPRVYGFELLMAPYAVAHMKLGLQLQESGYDFGADERLRVFLTNSLEEGHELAGLPLFAQWLADEAAAASEVKRDAPIMVIVGNPPYSGHSSNKGAWIEKLMEEYKRSPELKKPAQAKWLSDDYVKFIRFGQWRIDETGYGILAFISNHGWLDNPTFLDMRDSLMTSFTDIYVLDLHGNKKKKEVAPDGTEDRNVFDIQQGVAISIFVKRPTKKPSTEVRHAEIWGDREQKYDWLLSHDVTTTQWTSFVPRAPKKLFIPQDEALLDEYEMGWSIADAMNVNGPLAPGVVTTHDEFAISFSKDEAAKKVEAFMGTATEEQAREIWRLCTTDQWSYERAKNDLPQINLESLIVPILYRPFDVRWTVYDRNVAVHRRERVMSHMLQPNLALVTARSNKSPDADHFFCSQVIVETKCGESTTQSVTIPLWLYPTVGNQGLFGDNGATRTANFSPAFIQAVETRIGATVDPEQLFSYIYAAFLSPSYRARFGTFLKRNYPRVPLPSDNTQYLALATIGDRLIRLHTLRDLGAGQPDFPVSGSNRVDKSLFDGSRVFINKDQYFAPVAKGVWEYHIGGYLPAQRWLKDRRNRLLSYDELSHYRRVIAAISETITLQDRIDEALPDLGSERT